MRTRALVHHLTNIPSHLEEHLLDLHIHSYPCSELSSLKHRFLLFCLIATVAPSVII